MAVAHVAAIAWALGIVLLAVTSNKSSEWSPQRALLALLLYGGLGLAILGLDAFFQRRAKLHASRFVGRDPKLIPSAVLLRLRAFDNWVR